jgi:ABC-type Zn uptake system ZnuABC Zn-binding protein ZnuA
MPEIRGTLFACRLLHDTRRHGSGNGQSGANQHLSNRLILLSFSSALLIGLILCLAGGCSKPTPVHQSDPVRALASVYVMGDIINQIGDDRVHVEWFIESGQPLDPIPATSDRRQQWLNAALVVTRGLPDPWTYQGAGDAYQDRRILRVDLLPAARSDSPMSYMWLDPRVGIEIAQEVTDRLIARDPRSETLFRRNAEAFVKQVQAVMKEVSATTKASGVKPFVSLDPGFDPLAKWLGMKPVKLISGIDPNQPDDLSAAELARAAHDAGAKAVFINSETPDPVVQDWSQRIGLPVLTLDAVGTSVPSGRSSYLKVLHYNVEQLLKN